MDVDFTGKEIVVGAILYAVQKVIDKYTSSTLKIKQDQKEKIFATIDAIKTASQETEKFITSSGYQTNNNLSKLWRESLSKAVAADIKEGLEKSLYDKANFWGNPQEWLRHPSAMELVPTLRELDNKCDILLEMVKGK